MARQKPDGTLEDKPARAPELMKHAESLISAVHAKDSEAVADAMSGLHDHFNPKQEKEEQE